jgi:Icc-related predicted phosphoesterase
MFNLIYGTDLHGDEKLYKKLLDLAVKNRAKAILIGGDTSPGLDVQVQRSFFEHYLIPKLKEFRERNGDVEIFIIMGNEDYSVNMDVLEKAEEDGVLKVAHNKVHKIGDKFLVGYSFISPIPFIIRDWEKLEQGIRQDLQRFPKWSDPKKTIYMFHEPPFKTNLDIMINGNHVGGAAVREFIEKEQPFLTLHGHIHEAPDVSGVWKEKFGKGTLCVNPGNGRFVVFDLDLKSIELKK